MTITKDTSSVEHKQACADRCQFFIEQQRNLLRQIQMQEYKPTHDQRLKMDGLIASLDEAEAAYLAADLVCDVPVYWRSSQAQPQ
jgi:hypothetical protein